MGGIEPATNGLNSPCCMYEIISAGSERKGMLLYDPGHTQRLSTPRLPDRHAMVALKVDWSSPYSQIRFFGVSANT